MRRRSDMLRERFGDPIGSYAGDAPVGVRDESSTPEVCYDCGMMKINGACDCSTDNSEKHVYSLGESKDELEVEPCEGCGLIPIDGECECNTEEPHGLGMPRPVIHKPVYRIGEAKTKPPKPCPECGGTYAITGDEPGTLLCHDCGATYTKDGKLITTEAGCTHQVDEVAPPGHEKMVKGLKKAKGVDNPWAVAWAHHNKKHKK